MPRECLRPERQQPWRQRGEQSWKPCWSDLETLTKSILHQDLKMTKHKFGGNVLWNFHFEVKFKPRNIYDVVLADQTLFYLILNLSYSQMLIEEFSFTLDIELWLLALLSWCQELDNVCLIGTLYIVSWAGPNLLRKNAKWSVAAWL